jgi:hypothetical protein
MVLTQYQIDGLVLLFCFSHRSYSGFFLITQVGNNHKLIAEDATHINLSLISNLLFLNPHHNNEWSS